MSGCAQCGMVMARDDEYHPYAACLMFMGCHDGDTVRANLREVVEQAFAELGAGRNLRIKLGPKQVNSTGNA